jgi:hypothetical protein
MHGISVADHLSSLVYRTVGYFRPNVAPRREEDKNYFVFFVAWFSGSFSHDSAGPCRMRVPDLLASARPIKERVRADHGRLRLAASLQHPHQLNADWVGVVRSAMQVLEARAEASKRHACDGRTEQAVVAISAVEEQSAIQDPRTNRTCVRIDEGTDEGYHDARCGRNAGDLHHRPADSGVYHATIRIPMQN